MDYSFCASTSDNKNLRIKTLLLTRKEINNSIAATLKKNAAETLKREIKKLSFAEIMQAFVAYKIQGGLKKQLAKIYPLKTFEIRYAGIEKKKKTEEGPEKEETEESIPQTKKPLKKAEEAKEEKTEEKTRPPTEGTEPAEESN